MKLRQLGVGLAGALALSATQTKADFLEGVQTPPPGQIQVIGTVSHINKVADADGNKKDVDIDRAQVNTTLKLKGKKETPYFVAVTLPHVTVNNHTAKQSAEGFGDVSLSAGTYGSLGKLKWLLTGEGVFHTGDYDQKRKANAGSGDTLVGAGLRLTREWQVGTLDATLLGYRVLEADDGKPDGNQFSASVTPGVKIGKLRAGVEVTAATDSREMGKITVGGLVRYTPNNIVNISVGAGSAVYGTSCPLEEVIASIRVRCNLGR